jgi:hypothetical protein
MTAAGSKRSRRQPATSFTIHFQPRDPSDEELCTIIEAASAGAARRQVRDRFPGQSVLRIEKGATARFIKGEFRFLDRGDDSVLFALRK